MNSVTIQLKNGSLDIFKMYLPVFVSFEIYKKNSKKKSKNIIKEPLDRSIILMNFDDFQSFWQSWAEPEKEKKNQAAIMFHE